MTLSEKTEERVGLEAIVQRLVTVSEERDRLKAINAELVSALKNARHALAYCLNHHMPADEMLRPKCELNLKAADAALSKAEPNQ